jgi:hypothetical protein
MFSKDWPISKAQESLDYAHTHRLRDELSEAIE